ncbi:MAG: hypothetical protein P8J33_11705 [Pirellulaceae bacterium]|nr:hypothetical protein [Pirellulaceae bacterium]
MIKPSVFCAVVIALIAVAANPATAQINALRAQEQGPFQLQSAPSNQAWNPTGNVGVNDSSAAASLATAGNQRFAEREIDFGGLITQLVTSTLVVLGLCVAFLLIAKKFRLDSLISPRGKPRESHSSSDMKLESTLRLGRCNTLHIVEAGGNRLAVGMDATGIKTIVPLQPIFSQQLDAMQMQTETPLSNETNETNEERLARPTRHTDVEPRMQDRFGNYRGGFPIL